MDTGRPRLETGDWVEEVVLCPEQHAYLVWIGRDLIPEVKNVLASLFREYQGVFAWTAKDVLGHPTKVVIHKLNVDL